jgi:hypothetical protein
MSIKNILNSHNQSISDISKYKMVIKKALHMSEKIYEAAMGLLKLAMMKSRAFIAGKKTKKSMFQVRVLEEVFAITELPSTPTQLDLALLLKIPQRSVQIWFQNARQIKKRRMQGRRVPPSPSDHLGTTADYAPSDRDDVYEIKVHELLRIINNVKASLG